MPNLNPLSSATVAVNAARTLTRELEQRILMPAVEAVTSDGRKQRWEKHKQERRAELTAGTVAAIRDLGADAGMDEIASHVGVSKTVLYRYFADKNDLAAAVTVTYMESTLLPKVSEALSDDLIDYDLVRAVIGAYVETVSEDPNLYRFTTGRTAGSSSIAHTERIFAGAVASTLEVRLAARGAMTTGARTWATAIVGAIIRAVDDVLAHGDGSTSQLVDELTMLVWGGLVGIVTRNGDPEAFAADPLPMPPLPDEEPT
ncbi:putative TetR-family transcriptional regulator [Gordonia spumicola]|uniref:Putative TetR-family transcriptional regulator n=1 Tax=Gordonia spumicola TaxID=589161 RepID=A0A7I9V7D7_9ACTN|nr:TetR/AcrR family transcriptional regulator [Gordonia spumicola]GEE01298.1 putative TetR-family transcriptional regulator [Gordonia spumicola]